MGELKTRLEGEPIDNGELLAVKSAQLEEIKAHIKGSATLVDSMFAENPVQVVITRETRGMRVTQAEIKVHACEELVAKMQAAINARNAAIVEAAAAAATAATAEASAAKKKIGPKFEKQSLSDFKSGKLREFPTWKKDWTEMVSGNYDDAYEMRLIRNCVPESVRHVVSRFKSMPEIWEFLDEEFEKHSKLTSERVDYLHTFQYSKGAVSEPQKFMELYDR